MNTLAAALPIHPTRRHPLTGKPIRALWVSPAGRVCWPIMGGAPDGAAEASGSSGGAGTEGASGGAGAGGTGGSGGASGPGGRQNATDAQGNDLGFPRETPIAEMNDKEQAAYWRHNARKHENRFKDLIGERDPAEVKNDLDAYAKIQRDQQTPAEQALTDAREQGKTEGIQSERTKAATAIFRGALESNGITGDDLDEIASNFNVASYITDDGIDTTKITNFAKRFAPAGTGGGDGQQRRRDFGGGARGTGDGNSERGKAGKDEAARRFKKTKTTTDA